MFFVVLGGGNSPEREISFRSCEMVMKSMDRLGHKAILIDAVGSFVDKIRSLNPQPDLIFNGLHGDFGEDGCVQGLCELMNWKYTHSGVLASAICMHKPTAKQIFSSVGIPTPKWGFFNSHNKDFNDIKMPLIVKPQSCGSSINVSLVKSIEDLPANTDDYFFEEYISGKELTVGVLGDRVVGCWEIAFPEETHGVVFDYNAKYSDKETKYFVPQDIPKKTIDRLFEYAIKAHNACGCEVISRADFRYNPDTDEIFILELNTHPGLTQNSLIPTMCANNNISFDSLIQEIIDLSLCKKTKYKSFDLGVGVCDSAYGVYNN